MRGGNCMYDVRVCVCVIMLGDVELRRKRVNAL